MGLVNKFLDFIGIEEPEEELEEDSFFDGEEQPAEPRPSGRRGGNRGGFGGNGQDFGNNGNQGYNGNANQSFAGGQNFGGNGDTFIPSRQAQQQQQPQQQNRQATERRGGGQRLQSSAPSGGGLPLANGMKMIVYHPVSYEDTQNIIDNIKNRKPVIVNMEELEIEVAQRILDFLSGAVYALDGTMNKISRGIFVVAPANCDVVGGGEEEFEI